MLAKTRAIVLHHIDYGETSLLLYCYTREYGRITFVVSGVRKRKSRIPAHYFQPLNILDIHFYHKANRNMFRLKEVSCPAHYATIPFDINKRCIAMFLAEVMYRTLHEEESNTVLFDFCEHAYQTLDGHYDGTSGFHLMFLLHFSKYLGIYPSGLLEGNTVEMQADLQVFHDLPEKARNAVISMMQTNWSGLAAIHMDGETRNLILDKMVLFYKTHLHGMFHLKSLPVLKEVFR